MPKPLSLLLLVLCITTASWAQDPHFSQFYNAPGHLNPAMTGVFAGHFRVGANYRNQWSSVLGADAFQTFNASADLRIPVFRNDYFAVGVQFLQDQAGAGRLRQTNAGINVGYLKQLVGGRYRSDQQFLVAGMRLGLGQFAQDQGNFWFSNQYNSTETVDPTLPSNEALAQSTGMFPDLGAGLMYYAVFDEDASVYVGGSMYHLNRPDVAFQENSKFSLYQRIMVHAGGQIPLNPNFSLLPAAMMGMQGPSREVLLGSSFRLTNNDWYEVAIRAGVWARVSNRLSQGSELDALIYSFILEMERWQLGLSYDVNHSSLDRASNGRGGFEVSLIYVHPYQARYRVNCPNF